MENTIHHADARISVKQTGEKKTVIVTLKNGNDFTPVGMCETTYPIALIENILEVKGPYYLCDEIMRDESPEYVEKVIYYGVFGYVNRERFAHKKILDFGCGCGASTAVLSRMLPDSNIVGVELESNLLRIAALRAKHHKISNRVKFYVSPDGNSLPEDIGDFDFILLSGVYEHLLPQERRCVLPHLWRHLKPNGILFLNQTPDRCFPVEVHTTGGLVFINYMPDKLALFYAHRFSKRGLSDRTWPMLLREGIRGGRIGEIMKTLGDSCRQPSLLAPKQHGLKDRIDMWYAIPSKPRNVKIKRAFFYIFKLIKMLTGYTLLPTLTLAIRKQQGKNEQQ